MKYFLFIGFLLSFATSVYAQSDSESFNVRFLYGSETTAPTTPVLLSVDPISPNQIDLNWSAATDNLSVQGYVVTRGSSTIATTTLTSYSDTSVSASTTYSYSISAFDAAGNYSSSSNSMATTTPDFPVTPPVVAEDSSSQGTVARIVVQDFQVTPGVSTTSIETLTARPVRLTVRWGRTDDYELGYSVSEYYSTTHRASLTDLEPGTTYTYEIIAETPFGLESIIQTGEFTTLDISQRDAPVNVSRLVVTPENADVVLTWQMPSHETVAFVRIVRSNFGFPEYPQNGAVVYQGTGARFVDENILSEYSPVYYTAFVYDLDGNVSSGAVAIAFAQSGVATQDELDIPNIPSPPIKVPEATSTVDQDRFTPDMRLPELSEVLIVQGDSTHSFIDPDIVLSSADALTIRIPVSTVAGNLKSIIGTLLDPTNNQQSYAFLLRINKDRTYYEAVVPAILVTGESVLEVTIYDYESFTVATLKTPVEFTDMQTSDTAVVFPDIFFTAPAYMLLSVLFGVILLILLLVLRHRHEDKAE